MKNRTEVKMKLKKVFVSTFAIAWLVLQGPAVGAEYPEKPIRLVVPFPPGGTTDTVARVVAVHLSSRLGQPVLVDNRPGAGSSVGAEAVAKAPADGYTLLFAPSDVVILAALKKQIPYDPVTSLSPVARIATPPLVIAAGTGFAAANVADLVRIAKAKPGEVKYGSSGVGSIAHLAGELFAMQNGFDMVHVPYGGGAPAVVDLIGNQIELAIAGPVDFAKRAEAGQLKILAQTGPTRHKLVEQVPTLRESSANSAVVMSWFGVLAPSGTPSPIVQRLTRELMEITSLPEVRQRLIDVGCDSASLDGPTFGRFVAGGRANWTKVVADAKIPLQD